MVYRATYRDRVGVLVIMLAVAAFFIIGGMLVHEILLIVLGNGISLFFIGTKIRVRLETSDEGLVYVSLLTRWQANWSDISGMKSMHDYGYPAKQVYTGWAYELRLRSGKRKIISFFFLPRQALNEVRHHLHF